MAKFEVEMELQGFKLRIKAQREEDVPRIVGQISQQMAGLVSPSGAMLEATPRLGSVARVQELPAQEHSEEEKGKARGKSTRRRSVAESAKTQAITWRHNPERWGTPKQSWTAAKKILWIMYVISHESTHSEVSGPVIAETFNSAFRQSGPLHKPSMPRDLGSLKTRSPANVMDDATKSPIAWFLTDEGKKEAEKLVAEAKTAQP